MPPPLAPGEPGRAAAVCNYLLLGLGMNGARLGSLARIAAIVCDDMLRIDLSVVASASAASSLAAEAVEVVLFHDALFQEALFHEAEFQEAALQALRHPRRNAGRNPLFPPRCRPRTIGLNVGRGRSASLRLQGNEPEVPSFQ